MEFEFIAISEQIEGGRTAVKAFLDAKCVSFELNGESCEWSLDDCEIEVGGAAKGLIYLKNEGQKEVVLYTRDKSFLKHSHLRNHQGLKSKAKHHHRFYQKRMAVYVSVVLGLLLLPILFYMFKTPIIKKVAQTVPVSWEKEAGDQLFKTLKGQYQIIDDKEISAQLEEVFTPLLEVVPDSEVKFKFYLCADPSLNAFALPGGHVVINSGTIDKLSSIEELYGVIGHEMAHVTERHHIRGIIGNLSTFLIFRGFLGDEAGIIGAIGESAGSLESLFYSRNFERESDEVGLNYLVAAKIDPQGMVSFFEKIKKEYEQDQSKVKEAIGADTTGVATETLEHLEDFASTHPGVEERIQYLKKRIAKENIHFKQQDFDLAAFKSLIQSKID